MKIATMSHRGRIVATCPRGHERTFVPRRRMPGLWLWGWRHNRHTAP
jgi:hypothetical protein